MPAPCCCRAGCTLRHPATDWARCKQERLDAQARADKRGKLAIIAAIALVISAILLGFAWSAKETRETRSAAAAISEKHDKRLVVYTMNGCGACAYARKYMDEHGISYVERPIDGDVSAYAELESLDTRIAVPTFVVGDEVLTGMDPTGVTLERAMTKHGIRRTASADTRAMR